jgi:SH3-like domain-containing protein
LGSRAKEYLEKAQRCDVLAEQERDQVVRAALLHAARQWRNRALLDQRRTNASLPWKRDR